MSVNELSKARRAAEKYDRAAEELDAAILAAHEAGETNRAIARATGLSHTGIAKVLTRLGR